MSAHTVLTVHAPAWSRRGSRQFTYELPAADALNALVAAEFPGATIVGAGNSAYLVADGTMLADVDIEVIA